MKKCKCEACKVQRRAIKAVKGEMATLQKPSTMTWEEFIKVMRSLDQQVIATARIPSDRMKPNASIKVTVKGEKVSDFGYEFGFTDGPVRNMVAQERYDKMHRRAQKAEGSSKHLYKSLRRYEKMLEQAYLIIGTEIGRGTRLVMDPVPLIKDAQLMPAFKTALHSGYKAGESLSPELKHGEKTITINTHEITPMRIEDYAHLLNQ